jgi:DNA-binding HxlR family transcriptional regulator
VKFSYAAKMQRTDFGSMSCSIARTLAVAGEPWTPLILRDIVFGLTKFDEIQRDLGVATNILTDRLSTLVTHGLLTREPYQRRPLRYRYELTEKGADLLPVLLAMIRWGDRWTADQEGPPVMIVHRRCGQPTEALMVCSACKGPLHGGEVGARVGPGASRGPGSYLLPGWLNAPGRPEIRDSAPPPNRTSAGRFPKARPPSALEAARPTEAT